MRDIINSRIQNIIENLYRYKLSIYYQLHFATLMVLGVVLAYVFLREWRIKDQAFEFRDGHANSKKSVEQFNK